MDEVRRRLDSLEAKLTGPALKAGLAAAALEAKKHALANARREFYTGDYSEGGYLRKLTGNLLASIQTQVAVNGKSSVLYVGAEYGGYLEMGTSRGIRPRHYIKRAVIEHMSEIKKAFALHIRKRLV